MSNTNNQFIVLFDGVCHLCQWSVQFIIKQDPKKRFVFASLQLDDSKAILLQKKVKNNLNSIVFIEKGRIYTESTAVLKILKHLNNGLSLLYIFIIIPSFIRDFFYKIIAKNRYKWFGKTEKCIIPSKELKERFL
ncbi:MAG: thiol-disulfide oxidoreductase DCC family protein [Flavobacteriaceae bacterium]|nr:thiol-disulfide oxidoreductase DCC family protein [Flavobacteriaceae bacterium]